MTRTLIAVLLTGLLAACATPYGKYGVAGGYTDNRIDENTFSISVDTNGFTSQQTTSMHALYRAAELTVESGFDYFVIFGRESNPTSMGMVMPSTSTTYGRTTTTGATTVLPMVFPNSTLLIKSFKGTKPEGNANAYDARSLMKYLGPQIGLSK
jgi:hypothetical protein